MQIRIDVRITAVSRIPTRILTTLHAVACLKRIRTSRAVEVKNTEGTNTIKTVIEIKMEVAGIILVVSFNVGSTRRAAHTRNGELSGAR